MSQVHEDTGAYGEAAPLASKGTSFTVVLDTHAMHPVADPILLPVLALDFS